MVSVIICLLLLSIELIYFKKSIEVISYFQDGKVFVKFYFEDRCTSGWVKRSMFYSCINGKYADYDIIRIEKNSCSETFIYGDIRQMKEIRSIIKIVLGSL